MPDGLLLCVWVRLRLWVTLGDCEKLGVRLCVNEGDCEGVSPWVGLELIVGVTVSDRETVADPVPVWLLDCVRLGVTDWDRVYVWDWLGLSELEVACVTDGDDVPEGVAAALGLLLSEGTSWPLTTPIVPRSISKTTAYRAASDPIAATAEARLPQGSREA